MCTNLQFNLERFLAGTFDNSGNKQYKCDSKNLHIFTLKRPLVRKFGVSAVVSVTADNMKIVSLYK